MLRRLLPILFALQASMTWADEEGFATLKGHGGPIMGVSVSPSGKVATASFDNSVGLWPGPVWLEGHDAAVTAVHYADDDLLISGGDDFRVLGWRAGVAEPVEIIRHKGKVSDLAYDAGGGAIASASWDGAIGISQIDGTPSVQLTGHDAGVTSVAFGGRDTLFSGSSDGTIRHWSLRDQASRVIVRHGFGVNRIVVDQSAGWLAYGAVDGGTRVIDLKTETALHDFTLERRPILSMAYHPGTGQLAVGDGHGYIMMIDTNSWKITRDFRATRRGPVWALAFSPDGQMIYAGGLDDVGYRWPVALLKEFDPAISGERDFLRDVDTMPNGERQFMRKCAICHALTPPPSRKAGPTLYGVFGRAAGTLPDYRYSPILARSDIIWGDDTIDLLFDLGPDHVIPGSKMPQQRITGAQDRADLIAFLKTATAAEN